MDAADIPVWVAIIVTALSIAGAILTLFGCVGLARFSDFYSRIHAPTLGTSFGTIFIVMASMLYFFVSGQRPAVHELLILGFVLVTTPVTLMLLARAALYRDRAEANGNVPDPVGQDVVVEPENPAQS